MKFRPYKNTIEAGDIVQELRYMSCFLASLCLNLAPHSPLDINMCNLVGEHGGWPWVTLVFLAPNFLRSFHGAINLGSRESLELTNRPPSTAWETNITLSFKKKVFCFFLMVLRINSEPESCKPYTLFTVELHPQSLTYLFILHVYNYDTKMLQISLLKLVSQPHLVHKQRIKLFLTHTIKTVLLLNKELLLERSHLTS